MEYTSLSISFRIGLAFHAMNNEGSSGTNVMEPRRISVGGHNYDGISGEMVRRHVLENLVGIAKSKKLPLSLAGEGLHSDRAKDFVKQRILLSSGLHRTLRFNRLGTRGMRETPGMVLKSRMKEGKSKIRKNHF